MTIARKLVFALVTLGLIVLLLEGAARLVWWRLEHRALEGRHAKVEAALRNDNINYMKQADRTLGYVLIAGFTRNGTAINADGFGQRDRVPLAKSPGVVRLAAMGESTTFGHDADTANYPVHLGRIVRRHGQGYAGVEVINGGVPGWTSDQVALWAERKVGPYAPDVVVLYVGWNDFQSYDPFHEPPAVSAFETAYGSARFLVDASPLKLVPLSSALYDRAVRTLDETRPRVGRGAGRGDSAAGDRGGQGTLAYTAGPDATYRFYLSNLDRILAAFRRDNADVLIAICTVIGRWPAGTAAQFYQEPNGAVWWMRQRGLDPEQAAATLVRFNDLIRDYARARNLLLIDTAAAFSSLDRGTLQWDFAHLTAEGYELLAEVIYDGLRAGGYVRGAPSPTLGELRDAYPERPLRGRDAPARRAGGAAP